MGAQQFTHEATGKTPAAAFDTAQEDARHEYGHGGYTGTIAEKSGYRLLPVPDGENPRVFITRWMDDDTPPAWFDDKWGPAACIKTGEDEYTFFGWASS